MCLYKLTTKLLENRFNNHHSNNIDRTEVEFFSVKYYTFSLM